MTTKVFEYWERPWYRRGFVALALIILIIGVGVTFGRSDTSVPSPVLPQATNPYAPLNRTVEYGHKIKLPASILPTTRNFIRDAILRENPTATWSMVTAKVREGLTRSQWASGNIPIPEFPHSVFASAGVQVVRARQREILLDVMIGSKKPSFAPNIEALIEFRRAASGGWIIDYVAPKGGSIPVPAAQ